MARDAGRYRGALYRALNPLYARTPLSGEGAARYGGRFNARGTPALYTALTASGALREANQVGSLQPTVMVSYRADLGPLFDARDGAALATQGLTQAALGDPAWRARMLEGAPVPTQDFAARLIAGGYCGLLVPSFARGARPAELNLVLWRWEGPGISLSLVDDENRLSRL